MNGAVGSDEGGITRIIRAMATEARFSELVKQIEETKAKLAAKRRPVDRAELAALAAEKMSRGRPVTRAEAAAYLGKSTRHLQRLESRGRLRRCPDSDHPVSYAARDVLRLASANGKEA